MVNAELKKIENARSMVGSALAAAIRAVGWSQKEAADALDCDPAQLARWIHGTGNDKPQIVAIWACERLRGPFVIALADISGQCDVTTTISIRRRA